MRCNTRLCHTDRLLLLLLITQKAREGGTVEEDQKVEENVALGLQLLAGSELQVWQGREKPCGKAEKDRYDD